MKDRAFAAATLIRQFVNSTAMLPASTSGPARMAFYERVAKVRDAIDLLEEIARETK